MVRLGTGSGKLKFFTGSALVGIAPFIMLSVGIAVYCQSTGLDNQIARVFHGHPATAIIAAGFFGGLSPFCSCGVVSLIAGFLRAGVPLAPVMAFWIASPLMDPEMFILVSAVLGTSFALAKTVFAISTAIFPVLQWKFYRAADSFKTVCEPIELYQAAVLHVDHLP